MIDVSVLDQLTAQAANDGVQQLVVGAIIQDENKVLLLKRPDDDFMGGIFELPSGKVEGTETLDVATIREVEEETGLVVTDITEYIGSFDYTSGSGKKSRQLNFAVTVDNAEEVTLSEHDAYFWVSLDDDLPSTDAVIEVLERYKQFGGWAGHQHPVKVKTWSALS